ncbi:MAG: hypothetical protein CVV25_02425 [Ignavibacteriae bacterium HGW-Ignavibacteriae-4]|jgi:hypothetical protein|nr:MAG: hypothetical protein CVV25_02425 [Ignavibacteriae bacterium HGW-Ignavibacteriae-4]
MKTLRIIILLAIFTLTAKAQDAEPILNKLVTKLEKVKPYTVDLKINIDVEFLKIKERKAKLVYNGPDDIDINSDDFMLMPKNGAQMEYLSIIKNRSAAIYEGTEKDSKGNTLTKIKIIPGKNKDGVILANMVINEKTNRLVKMKAFTESNGSFISEFEYGNNLYDMPSKVLLEFDMKNFQIPAHLSGDIDAVGKKDATKKETTTGKVVITYTGYKKK